MLGIIGGSGLYQIDGLEILDEIEIDTPFGNPSDKYVLAQYNGKKAIFLPRHGKGHKYPPHLINYRANIWGFRKLNVDRILSISAVGGINPLLKPGDFVISKQFLDFTTSRTKTFYEGVLSKCDDTNINDDVNDFLNSKKVVHIDVTDPFCFHMSKILSNILDENSFRYHNNVTYVTTEGPRLETAAEIRMFKILGGDVVGMTLVPEVILARELNIHFVSLNVVTNPAAGTSEGRLTSDEVVEMMKEKIENIKKIVLDFINKGDTVLKCNCEEVLKGAAI